MAERKTPISKTIVALFIMVAIVSFCCGMVLPDIYNEYKEKKAVTVFHAPDCAFQPVHGYDIVWLKRYKKWAVRAWIEDRQIYNNNYLYSWDETATIISLSIDEFGHGNVPTMFNDTCAAKGYLKAYLVQKNEKFP